jgi:iron complex outermembrane receptor protein/vitamin B12 transporter
VLRSIHSRRRSRFLTILVLAVLLCPIAVTARAQAPAASVGGAVLDPLGARIPGANVTLLREGQHVADTKTDEKGEFVFHDLKAGRYEIEADAGGFAPRTVDPFFVGERGQTVVNVTLQVGREEQQVVVTAAATATPASQVGASVTVLDADTLKTLDKPDVLEALRLVPGTSVVQTGARGGITSIFTRGGASNFNKVLIDGVPANDIGGAFDFSEVATTGVDRVEVLRDSNSVLYGSDALAGVINLTTKRGHTRIPELSLAVDGGNFGTLRQDLSVGGLVSRFDYFSALSHFGTDNSVPNNDYHNTTYAGRFDWAAGNNANLAVTVRHFDSRNGSPNGFSLFGIADDSSQKSDATYVGATYQAQLSRRWQTMVRFASMGQGFHTVNPSPTGEPFDPFGFGSPNYLGDVVTLTGANGYSATGQAILDYSGVYPILYDANTTRRSGYGQMTGHLADWLDLSAGARVDHEDGFTIYAGDRSASTRTNAGAFTEARITLHRLFASAGLGYDHNAIFQSAVTPRASVAFYLRDPSSASAFGDTKLTFNVGSGIKAPGISQELSSLYALIQDLPAGSRPATAVSPIGPERNRSLDAGIEQGFWNGQAHARLTFFDNQFSDLIEYVSSTALPRLGIPADVAAASGFGAYVNSSSYGARGVELSGEAALGPYVQVRGSYTHLHAVVTESFASTTPAFNPAFPEIPIGAYGPLVGAAPFRRPANTGSLLVAFTKSPVQVALAGYFSGKSDDSTFLSDAYFGNSLLLPNHDLIAAYQKIDLSGSYQILPRLRWSLSIENIFDQSYAAAFGFPALPRSVRTGLTLTLGGDRPSQP